MYYLNYFFVFSILGHLMETLLFNKSGILISYWTPIYGVGVLLIILIHKYLSKYKFDKISLFFISALVLSTIEAIGGYLIEFIFNQTFWDYSSFKFNIGKYTALEMALIWGTLSVLISWIRPYLDKIISKIPKYFTYILTILFIIDFILTIKR